MRRNGLEITEPQTADEPTVFSFPSANEHKYRISDDRGNLINDVDIRTCTDTNPGFELGYSGRTESGGIAHFELEETPRVQFFLAVAPGFAPEELPPYVSSELVDITMRTPGRKHIIVDTAAQGVILDESKSWIIDAWGDFNDPRQGLVTEYCDGNELSVIGAPLGEFNFLEIDSTGRPTNRVINVPAL